MGKVNEFVEVRIELEELFPNRETEPDPRVNRSSPTTGVNCGFPREMWVGFPTRGPPGSKRGA